MSEKLTIEEMQKEIDRIDSAILACKTDLKRGVYLDELLKDKRFISVFMEGYIKEELARVINLIATPGFANKEDKDSLIGKLDQIKHFKEYIGSDHTTGLVKYKSDNALAEIDALKLEKEQLSLSGGSV